MVGTSDMRVTVEVTASRVGHCIVGVKSNCAAAPVQSARCVSRKLRSSAGVSHWRVMGIRNVNNLGKAHKNGLTAPVEGCSGPHSSSFGKSCGAGGYFVIHPDKLLSGGGLKAIARLRKIPLVSQNLLPCCQVIHSVFEHEGRVLEASA